MYKKESWHLIGELQLDSHKLREKLLKAKWPKYDHILAWQQIGREDIITITKPTDNPRRIIAIATKDWVEHKSKIEIEQILNKYPYG